MNKANEILSLKREIKRLKGVEASYKALITEIRLKDLLNGTLLNFCNSNGDLITLNNQIIEIKFSSNHSRDGARWSWHKILGNSNKKNFNYLLLVGEYFNFEKFFVFSFNELPKPIMKKSLGSYKIDIRYSEKDWSNYQKFLAPYEYKRSDLNKVLLNVRNN